MEGNKGFTNCGNTCYMNSALQCLIHLEELNPRENEIFKSDIRKSNKKEFKLLKQWIQLYKEMWYENDNSVIHTMPFIKTFIQRCEEENIYFCVYNQNDVSEFLNGFISILHEEIGRSVSITPSGEAKDEMDKLQVESIHTWNRYFNEKYSFIIKDFHLQAINGTSCPQCDYLTTNFDPMLLISLDINETNESIYDCLDDYTKTYTLDDDNLWKCDNCHKEVKCEKKNRFWKLPHILIIMIKTYNENRQKIDHNLEYPMELDMTPYCFNYKNESLNYELNSLCIHSGSLNGGHYYAYCKNYKDNQWRQYNDTRVSNPLEESEILDQKPYCLFYKRITDE